MTRGEQAEQLFSFTRGVFKMVTQMSPIRECCQPEAVPTLSP